MILDGYGLAPASPSNAISLAQTPVLDGLFASYPHTELSASGLDVGLPVGQMGNSEVGHTNIGAGRVVFQDLPRISLAIADGSFFENEAYLAAMAHCKVCDSSLHLMGLVSDGGVHSHMEHLLALVEMAKRNGISRVYIHAFLDGRDVPPRSAKGYITELSVRLAELGTGEIASVTGRIYAMDRDERWERVQAAYSLLTQERNGELPDAASAVQLSYDAGISDEFVLPTACGSAGGIVRENDAVVFFNFRPDRARELTRAFVDPEFSGFKRKLLPLHFVCTTEYDATMPGVSIAFPPKELRSTFGELVSSLGMTQLRIAETTKYAHVTFFFNGGDETVFFGEDRALIPTPEVETFDLFPEMSALGIADEAVRRIESGEYDVIILNFANCDMVGHTGEIAASIRAVETIDGCVGTVLQAVWRAGGVAVVTADHGNAEKMVGDDGKTAHTAHTTNPVPFILIGVEAKLRESGRLCDIAPTMLDIMGIEKPPEMTGESLIV